MLDYRFDEEGNLLDQQGMNWVGELIIFRLINFLRGNY